MNFQDKSIRYIVKFLPPKFLCCILFLLQKTTHNRGWIFFPLLTKMKYAFCWLQLINHSFTRIINSNHPIFSLQNKNAIHNTQHNIVKVLNQRDVFFFSCFVFILFCCPELYEFHIIPKQQNIVSTTYKMVKTVDFDKIRFNSWWRHPNNHKTLDMLSRGGVY